MSLPVWCRQREKTSSSCPLLVIDLEAFDGSGYSAARELGKGSQAGIRHSNHKEAMTASLRALNREFEGAQTEEDKANMANISQSEKLNGCM